MSEWSIKRRFPRYELRFPVLYRLKSPSRRKTGVGQTLNLSEGGACLELQEQIPPSTSLDLIIRATTGAIEAEAKVVWRGKEGPPGHGVLHGVSFTQLAPESHQALTGLFPKGRAATRRSIRVPLDLHVTCRIKGSPAPPLQGRTGNMSRGGLLLLLPQALPLSTGLEVTLPDADGKGTLTVEGTIVWVEPSEAQKPKELIRHGLRFAEGNWAQELAIGLLMGECLKGAPKLEP